MHGALIVAVPHAAQQFKHIEVVGGGGCLAQLGALGRPVVVGLAQRRPPKAASVASSNPIQTAGCVKWLAMWPLRGLSCLQSCHSALELPLRVGQLGMLPLQATAAIA
jgi:hypothetical protein